MDMSLFYASSEPQRSRRCLRPFSYAGCEIRVGLTWSRSASPWLVLVTVADENHLRSL